MDDALLSYIRAFFRWFRCRLANASAISTLSSPSSEPFASTDFLPDQHVLIGSGIDALANAWADAFRPDLAKPGVAGARRWSTFLEENANESGIFGRVSAPLLAERLEEKNPPNASAANVVRRVCRDEDHSGRVRFTEEDPAHASLIANDEIAALGIRSDIDRSRFGEILYREYRCQWAHRLYSSDRLAPSDYDLKISRWAPEYDHRVRYNNVTVMGPDGSRRHRRRLLFSLPWLLRVYEAAIDSFERRCLDERKDPLASLNDPNASA
jgi:hypothetical protein